MTIDVLDAMEAGVTSTTTFGAIEAGQGRIVPARAGNSNSEQCSKYYTQAFAFDDDDDADAAEEYDAEHAEQGEMRSGPLGKRPKGTAGGLKGGVTRVPSTEGTIMACILAAAGAAAVYVIASKKYNN